MSTIALATDPKPIGSMNNPIENIAKMERCKRYFTENPTIEFEKYSTTQTLALELGA